MEKIEVKCPKCGSVLSPKDQDLAQYILKQGAFICMKCYECGIEIRYDGENVEPFV